MKKNILLIAFTVLMFFISYYQVDARVNTKNTEIECVYANGVIISMNYDSVTKQNLVYVKNYPVANSVSVDFETISNISIYSLQNAKWELSKMTCPSVVYYWIVGEPTDDDDNYSYRGVYNFSKYANGASRPMVTSTFLAAKKTGWWIFSDIEVEGRVIPVKFKSSFNGSKESGCSSSYAYMPISYGTPTTTEPGVAHLNKDGKFVECHPYAEFGLVAERFYFVDDIQDNAYSHTYKLVNNNEQAISANKYAQIYKGGSDQYFLQIGQVVTSIDTGYVDSDYICVKQSVTSQDSNRGESSYKFSAIRHEITQESNSEITCDKSGGQLYVRTTETCKITVGNNRDSFCDKYSNTAFVLIDIIKIMQILVPAVVIIFSGIEIGRIVLAGNIEEELPKRKKSMVVRLIVMIAFFFLPTIVQLIISLAEGVSILDVSCLFNNGEKVEQNEALTEQNCVDEDNSETS